ncbi:sensor domain-containing diguanylate cyclase [Pseudoteredinibacter isoporae]|uniref:diguanylate cyclase n=1 Tax=Pseudoteredinibacter isoporae TaxID=570281 RepID=A0A7X0JUT4_9GAMM|nr:GGDEF domain-containing protein [Pseudoteredinibacter isoporae]MBB6522209.1 diguanylate cyclase (GGDEF)-like protein [Pseudoteredinibacter isoporae]NHO87743.1 GGDEF domain-containing protein [Pseudoteredinibacter isoporae]NIB23926.1 GGDEF domain-containing protein [Pseudoteredinibacter isoporae]
MVRDLWPLVVAIIIALLATLQPYAKVRSSESFPITAPFQEVDLSQWDFRVIKLDQHWRWYPNQLLEPGSTDVGTSREIVSLPHYFASQQALSGTRLNVGTYRLRLKLPEDSFRQNLSISVSHVCNSAKVYFYPLGQESGHLDPILEVGKVSAKAAEYRAELGQFHAHLNIKPGPSHYELMIQSAGFNSPNPGLCQTPVLGNNKALQGLEQLQLLCQGFIVAIIFSFGLYAIGTSVSGSRNRSYLWIGSAAVLIALSKAALDNFFINIDNPNSDAGYRLAVSLLYSTIMIGGALAVGFVHHSFRLHFLSHRFVNGNLITAVVLSVPFFLLPAEYSREWIIALLFFSGVQYLLVLYLLYKVLSHRLMYARRVTLYIAPLLIAVHLELAEYLGWMAENQFLLASLVFLVIAQGLTQSQKLARASKVASRLSQGLTDEVQKRVADLHLKNQELLLTQKELTRANRELRDLSVTDGLTSVFNRMYFDRQFISEWQRSRRDQKNLCLMLIDVDHFKLINDQHGHSAGDEILRSIANSLLDHFKRGSDIVCRYGGEEFIVILSDSSSLQASRLAEQLRQKVEDNDLRYQGTELSITISIGVCGLTPGPEHQPLDLLNAADQALYLAKREGRNCVRVAEPPAPNQSRHNEPTPS